MKRSTAIKRFIAFPFLILLAWRTIGQHPLPGPYQIEGYNSDGSIGSRNASSSSVTTIDLLLDESSNSKNKLADGCYHVFLDVGSNIGMHVRFLYEPTLYPDAKIARNFFKHHFGQNEGLRDNRDFCVFSFEPNPSQWERHEEMRRVYEKMGWRYHPIHGGVGDEDGNLTFYHVGDETGFTMLKTNCRQRCDPEYVPVYRLSDWIDREVHGRKIPEEPNAWYDKGPQVVMKMDIEMMEWLVIPDLLDTGVLCRDINGMMGEFHLKQHWFYYPITFAHSRLGDNYTVDSWQNATKLRDGFIQRMVRDPKCSIELRMKDDESHRNDGMPWPIPLNDTISIDKNATLRV